MHNKYLQFPEAIKLVRETGQTISKTARDLGIDNGTLGDWMKQKRINRRSISR